MMVLLVSKIMHCSQKPGDSVSAADGGPLLIQPWERLRLHEGHHHVAFADGATFFHACLLSVAARSRNYYLSAKTK